MPTLTCPHAHRLGAALVCASSFIIVSFEARSKDAPVGLKVAKNSTRLEVEADSHWHRLEAGAGGSTAGAAADEADGQLQLAEAWRGSATAASAAAAADAVRQRQYAGEDAVEDERAPLVRPQRPPSSQL